MNLFNFDAFGPGVAYLLAVFAIIFLIVGAVIVGVAIGSSIVLGILLKKKKKLNDEEDYKRAAAEVEAKMAAEAQAQQTFNRENNQ